jgi:hypothetical protein
LKMQHHYSLAIVVAMRYCKITLHSLSNLMYVFINIYNAKNGALLACS